MAEGCSGKCSSCSQKCSDDDRKLKNALARIKNKIVVMSGKGGELILSTCQSVLADEYPELAKKVEVMLPDEKTRRVGQSAAAASLPALKK